MSVSQQSLVTGDFTKLAANYAKYRSGYSETVIDALLGVIKKPIQEITFVDVGAGTGIWTRQFAKRGSHNTFAVEPNLAMCEMGRKNQEGLNIKWLGDSAEKISLENHCADVVSMASSFHWTNFDLATREFYRILKPHGYFVALWNPRYIENNILLQEIEHYLCQLAPNMQRISSGNSPFVNQLAIRLGQSSLFEDIIHIEGFHTVSLTTNEYLGVWESVNDVRSQLGEKKFQDFLDFVKIKTSSCTSIDCTYQTRAWIVKRK